MMGVFRSDGPWIISRQNPRGLAENSEMAAVTTLHFWCFLWSVLFKYGGGHEPWTTEAESRMWV